MSKCFKHVVDGNLGRLILIAAFLKGESQPNMINHCNGVTES